jgi:gliding motility-associated protein GldL
MATKKKSIFVSTGWKVGMKYLYGWGAAIVIFGALFKILHWPGADIMLIIGLTTEAVIFFFSAFEPLPHEEEHWKWDRVFPQLKDDSLDDEDELLATGSPFGAAGLNAPNAPARLKPEDIDKINSMTPELFESLAKSVKNLQSNVEGIADVASVSTASSDFASKLKNASTKVEQLANNYTENSKFMTEFNNSLSKTKSFQEQIQNETKNYHQQIQNVTKNLSSLNAIYEIELADSQKHINAINKFYGSITKVMQNLTDTSNDTDALRQEVGVLAKNMRALNTVYGNMLTAMASGAGK